MDYYLFIFFFIFDIAPYEIPFCNVIDYHEDLVAVGTRVARVSFFVGLGLVRSSEVVLYLGSSSDTL